MLSAATTATRSGSALASSPRGLPHLVVQVGRELADVLRLQLAPDRVLLPVNLNVDDA